MIYSENFPYRLEHIKHLCQENIHEITLCNSGFISMHEGEPYTDICVRYVYEEGEFGYAYMGDFFFIDDCMYVITDDEKFIGDHNDSMPEILKEEFGIDWGRQNEYVFRAIFAGIRTPYKDDLGDYIYTGDIVKANDYIISGICAFPPICQDESCKSPAMYGLMLDNHMLSLNDCQKVERLGTIFFHIDNGETEIAIESEIGRMVQHGGFDKDHLFCAKYTPSYLQELWKYKALEIIGIEYNWRRL